MKIKWDAGFLQKRSRNVGSEHPPFQTLIGHVKQLGQMLPTGLQEAGTKVRPDYKSGVRSLGLTRTDQDRPQNIQR